MIAFLALTNRILACLAGLVGALGVIASALAAHGGYGDNLNTAAIFALIHAALIIALTRGTATRMSTCAAALALAGTLLFCGDLSARAILKAGLFPMAAPTGGFLMIFAWLAASFDAAWRLKSPPSPL